MQSLSIGLQLSNTSDCLPGGYVPSGMTCHFMCSEGYYLQGISDLTCQHNRLWDNNMPTCGGKRVINLRTIYLQ